MFEKVSICPVCDGTEFSNAIICQDTLVSNESFVLADCQNCGFRITNPRPDVQSLPLYYDSPEYNPHSRSSKSIFSFLYNFARKININRKYKLINSLQSTAEILDYGCGTGEFLSFMKTKGWSTYGVEPNEPSRQYARSRYGLDVVENISYLPDNQRFMIITLWHVLEHVPDLNAQIQQLSARLKKEGLLFIAVPNYQSFDANYYKEHWAGYDVPRHLYHFSKKTMKKLLKRNKLSLKEVLPMKLDSYYVSILSERNRDSRNSFIKGLIKGYQSNIRASSNTNYSSLLYLVKK